MFVVLISFMRIVLILPQSGESGLREIKPPAAKKFYAKWHISGMMHDDDTDDEGSLPLADLMQLAKLHLTCPITPTEKYVDIDNSANIVHENYGNDWEQMILDDLSIIYTTAG